MKHTKPEDYPFMQLSKDLIFEILFRLPIKSLGRCTLLCKTLNSIISDPQFAYDHLEFSNQTKQPLTLVSQRNNVISKLELKNYKDITKGARLVEVKNQFPANEFDHYYCFMIGSCNGLVCIYLKSKSKSRINDDLMFIWNPVTDEREEIDMPNEYGKVYLHDDACWFGYISSRNEYMMFLSYFVASPEFRDRMYVYSFSSCRWREIRVVDEVSRCFAGGLKTVFLNEALYCLSGRRWVCKFDLVGGTFEKMPFSIGEDEVLKKCNVSLGVIGEDECLCVVFVQYPVVAVIPDRDEEGDSEEDEEEEEDDDEEEEEQQEEEDDDNDEEEEEDEEDDDEEEEEDEDEDEDDEEEEEDDHSILEVWMLEEYGNLNSWEKRCRIGLQGRISGNTMKFLGFTFSGVLCFQEEYGLRLIDPLEDPPSYAIATNGSWNKVYTVTNYVESLISPFDLSA